MKTVTTLLPIAVALTLAAGGIWWMLDREMTAGRWMLGAFVVAHGAVHLLYAVPEPEQGQDWPFDMSRSWAINTAGLDPATVKAIGWGLIAFTIASLTLAALATVGVAVPAAWWAGLVLTGAAGSTLALVMLFHPQLLLGFGINASLITVAAAGLWAPWVA